MNFERLAPVYPWMEHLLAGGLMQRCRKTFLTQTRDCRRALLVGEGPGRFLVELLQFNPHLEITCVEQSTRMIAQAQRRLRRHQLDPARVHFEAVDVLKWQAKAQGYDLIVTHFFLDCFPPDQLREVVRRLAASAMPEACWLVSDFHEPPAGWRRGRARVILALLYRFFRITTGLSASFLTPPDEFLREAGFRLVEREFASLELMHADVWRKG